jgi:hypothetical protein
LTWAFSLNARGGNAGKSEAAAMRGLLVIEHNGHDTSDVPADAWNRLLDEAVNG